MAIVLLMWGCNKLGCAGTKIDQPHIADSIHSIIDVHVVHAASKILDFVTGGFVCRGGTEANCLCMNLLACIISLMVSIASVIMVMKVGRPSIGHCWN